MSLAIAIPQHLYNSDKTWCNQLFIIKMGMQDVDDDDITAAELA